MLEFSISIWALAVVGCYFLGKEIFDNKLALISSFLLSVSSLNIFLSAAGDKNLLVNFALIFALYFLWSGLKYNHTFNFFLSGIFLGAGFYVGRNYLLAPLVAVFILYNYWRYIKVDFSLSKYEETKADLVRGFVLLLLTTVIASLPVGFYLWQNPEFILGTDGSVFGTTAPFAQFLDNLKWVVSNIFLVNFSGDNFVSWPVSIFLAIGFIKEFVHWVKRKHGHFSVAHTLIFSWLFVMLVPILLSANKPSATNVSLVLPPLLILTARGIWWFIDKLNKWGHLVYPRPHKHWDGLDAGPLLALIALLLSIAVLEISRLV